MIEVYEKDSVIHFNQLLQSKKNEVIEWWMVELGWKKRKEKNQEEKNGEKKMAK